MKKFVVVLMAAGLLLVAGCGESEKTLEGEVQNMVSGSGTSGGAGTEASQGTVQNQGEENSTGTEAAKGYVFEYDGTVAAADMEAAPVIEELGEPVSYFESTSCAFEGLDKMYTYSSFEIDTYPVEDKDYISTIILKDDSIATQEGIYIGDSLEKLQQTYGGGYTERDGMIVYEKDGMELCFIMKYEEIVSIEYRSLVLKE